MKQLLIRSLFPLQIHRLMRYVHRKKIVILIYHGFTDKPANDCKDIENLEGNHLYIGTFKNHIAYLAKHHHVISLEHLLETLPTQGGLPDYSVVITIDDGYRSTWRLAYPILKQAGLKATLFPATEFVDAKVALWPDRLEYAINHSHLRNIEFELNGKAYRFHLSNRKLKKAAANKIRPVLKSMRPGPRTEALEKLEALLGQKLILSEAAPEIYQPLEWDHLAEMLRSGLISVGSHSHTHTILTNRDAEGAKEELLISRQITEKNLGIPCRIFCYPNGWIQDFDAASTQLLREMGYSCGLTSIPGFVDSSSNIFELERFMTNNKDSMADFLTTFSLGRNLAERMKLLFRSPTTARSAQ